jgi:hypothetical protein
MFFVRAVILKPGNIAEKINTANIKTAPVANDLIARLEVFLSDIDYLSN